MSGYADFINRKSQGGIMSGFDPVWMPDFLFDFQQALVAWAVRRGRAAIFADCGLGKTPMQLVWAQNVVEKTNGRVLLLTPLAVGGQTMLEAEKFGIECGRSRDGRLPAQRIVITNYEKLHLFNPADFAGVVCDESSILKHFSGATQSAVTRFMLKIPYRLLCTATAAPNDYIELGTSSQALGELGYSDMLARFFKQSDNKMQQMQQIKDQRREKLNNHFGKLSFRVTQQIGQWHLKGHAATPFWQWIASWARACRKPSDLGFADDAFALPPLIERSHMIMPERPPDGMLLTLPAIGLNEERDERRRTLDERVALVAELVLAHRYSMIWCHMNVEGKTLERAIPYSINVEGADDDDYKEAAASWFKGEICICHDSRFRDKLAAWQSDKTVTKNDTTPCICGHKDGPRRLISKSKIFGFGINMQFCNHVVTFATHSYEQYYQSVRRCWRFGQKQPVTVDIIATEGERRVQENMTRKALAAEHMFSELVSHMNDATHLVAEHRQSTVEVPPWIQSLRPSSQTNTPSTLVTASR